MLIIVGILLMGSLFSINGALMSSFQDYIPTGTEGRFQGVRMCFTVLIPMIVGPIIALIIGMNTFRPDDADAIAKPDFWMFLASAVVAVLAFIPLIFVYKDSDRLRAAALARHEAEEAAEKEAEEAQATSDDGELIAEPAADVIESKEEPATDATEEPATDAVDETPTETSEDENKD